MNTEEILEEYEKIAKIDQLDLGNEALNITKHFSKFLRYLAIEGRELRRMETRYKQLVNLKSEWFLGTLNGTEELKKLGWEPMQRVVLKPDLNRHLEADRDVIKLTEMLGEQRDKVSIIKDIMKEVKDRSFNIRAAVDMRKFEAGI